MKESSLHFSFEARYYKLGEITDTTKSVWFVLHGYGQLARYFLPKFKILKEHNICVIAPEGLSRFYVVDIETRIKSGDNRVGSTWMTRENREMDIQNYVQYLDSIYKQELKDRHVPVTLLGFSQGAATVSRWAIHNAIPYQRLILWAGIFPPDMDFDKGHDAFMQRDVYMIYGTRDPYLNEDRIREMEMLTTKLRITPTVMTFEGGHEIDSLTLEKLV